MAKIFLFFGKLYLSSQTIIREFLYVYFVKITPSEEKKDRRENHWLLLGFGMAISLCFGLPIFGVMFYPAFQQSAADILIVMLNEEKLSLVDDFFDG